VTGCEAAWPKIRIGDLGEVFTGRTPATEHPAYFGDDYPFITPGDMHQGKYARATQRSVSHEGAELLKRIQVPANSVCVSCIGWQMGEVIMTDKPSFTNQHINTIVPNGKVQPSFLYYSLRPRKQELLSLGATTGVRTPILNKSAFCDLKVKIPPLPLQRRIAGILSAYDDLIENNQRRIKILEEMARALYREWFVKFRFPGHEKVPLLDSSLGSIPKGWEVKKLAEVLQLNYGKALKQEDRREGLVPVFGSSGIVGYHNAALVRGPGIIVGRKGNVGSVFWSNVDLYPIDTVYFVTSKLPLRFLFYELQTKNFINNDAAVPGLNRQQAYSLEMPVPPCELLAWFCRFADDFERQASVVSRENETLRRTRDLLSPRLLSGQICLESAG
jgi:type I restriction enzyme, S subunit